MFTPGRAGGQGVLVWEGSVAAPASPLAWHSAVPVEVFFHTGHQPATQELAPEFTRQLDRQLSALSLLSAERLLEGIRTYRDQGRQPTSKATRKRRKKFMKEVVDDLTRVHQFSEERALAETARIDRALVVLHEPDQLLAGPGDPAAAGGWPSLGHGAVNSSVGGQNKPMVAVLEQATLQVPPQQRSRVRLLVRAVLTDSPTLAQDLRHGQTVLEPRTSEQVSATSPRGPPWTPPTSPPPSPQATHPGTHPPRGRSHHARVTSDGITWHPPAQGQEPAPSATTRPGAGQPGPGQPTTSQPSPGPPRPSPTRTGATTAGPPQTAQPRAGQPPQTGATPAGPGQPGHKITPEEILADIKARVAQATQRTQQPAQPPTPHQTPTRKHRRNRGLGR